MLLEPDTYWSHRSQVSQKVQNDKRKWLRAMRLSWFFFFCSLFIVFVNCYCSAWLNTYHIYSELINWFVDWSQMRYFSPLISFYYILHCLFLFRRYHKKLTQSLWVILWIIKNLYQTRSILPESGPVPIRLHTRDSGVTGLLRFTGRQRQLWLVSLLQITTISLIHCPEHIF